MLEHEVFHRKRFRIIDAMVLTLTAAIAIRLCILFDDGLMTFEGAERFIYYARITASLLAMTLSFVLVLDPRERRTVLSRPGRSVLFATSISTILFFAIRIPEAYLWPDMFGDFQWMVADEFLFSPDSRLVYGMLCVFALGLLSRSYVWVIDWVELVGYGVFCTWIILSILNLVSQYRTFF